MKTENFSLLKEEYDNIIKLSQSKSLLRKTLTYIRYQLRKNPLMEKRDRFIADRINKTLQEEERGILFIGVYHNVLPLISKDIRVYEVKKKEKVKAYFDELILGKDEKKFNQLARYLVSPVKMVRSS